MNPNNQNSEITAGSKLSYWLETARQKKFETNGADTDTEVVVVGAGIAGLSIAYQLLLTGKKVIVVDDGLAGSGETGRTSAHLSACLDTRYHDLISLYGHERARLIAESHLHAIDTIEKICKTEQIDCNFKRVSGYLFHHETDTPETIIKEFNAAWESGLNATFHEWVYFLKNLTGPCLEFKNQATFHPIKYVNGLAEAIVQNGGRIFTGTHVNEINQTGVVTESGHHIFAQHIVVATNTPVNNKYVMHLNQFPYRTYVIGALVKKGMVENALFWDTGEQNKGTSFQPYHYVRLCEYNNMFDLLICGGEDHPTGLIETTTPPDEKSKYRKLAEWANERFPIESIAYEWSGQVLYAYDSLAYIGKNPFDSDNIFIVTGDCGNGLTYGVIAGSLITDLINKKDNKYAGIYSPARCKLWKAGSIFLEEFFSGLIDYYKVKNTDLIENLSGNFIEDGNIIEIDQIKYGISRIDSEWIDVVTTECTHLGCTLKWNTAEKSWDCPCHGSRFTQTGVVINGPANSNLHHYKIKMSDLTNYISNKKQPHEIFQNKKP